MNEEKTREEFEVWHVNEYGERAFFAPDPFDTDSWIAWQAACASKQKEIDALKAQVAEYDGLMEDNQTFQSEIARLNHQHKNDEAANMLLQEVCEMQRAKLMELTSNKEPVEPVEVYSPHTKVVE